MQPENRPTPSRNKSKISGPLTGSPGAKSQGSKPQPPVSLTAKMVDYRSWWNLPRSRSRKTH